MIQKGGLMEHNHTAQDKFNLLRMQAEELLQILPGIPLPVHAEDPLTLIQELQTFQIELEKQIEKLHRSRQALMEAQINFTELYDSAPVGYLSTTPKGVILKANLTFADMVMVERSGLINQPLSDWIAREDREMYYRHLDAMSDLNMVQLCELRLKKKDNTCLDVQLESKAVPDRQGNGVQYRTVVIDITQQKQAEKEKLAAWKMVAEHEKLALVGQIAGKMAHDFNNVLSIIMGNAELSLFSCEAPETRKAFSSIIDQTIRGKNLTRNLVAFAKDQEPRQQFFSINKKINLVLNLLKKDLEQTELIVKNEVGDCEILADPGMIEHAFVNILQNAVHATSLTRHPVIRIHIYYCHPNICFEIEDNGCGIPAKHLKHVYDPAFTLKGSRDTTGSYKTDIKGTGYGLSNVKKYIELHNGSICIKSELKIGTKITLRLPVIKKELTEQEKRQIRKGIPHTGKHILLVEDETALSEIQYKVLTQEPCFHTVDIADTGQGAMDLFDRNTYDFVSLDYILKGIINGMDVYHHIRKTNSVVPILFMSGNFEFLESIRTLKKKDSHLDHLSKPCQNKMYVDCINDLLERAEQFL